jgi:hypothetical protein
MCVCRYLLWVRVTRVWTAANVEETASQMKAYDWFRGVHTDIGLHGHIFDT